jgi:hypothetical protein
MQQNESPSRLLKLCVLPKRRSLSERHYVRQEEMLLHCESNIEQEALVCMVEELRRLGCSHGGTN